MRLLEFFPGPQRGDARRPAQWRHRLELAEANFEIGRGCVEEQQQELVSAVTRDDDVAVEVRTPAVRELDEKPVGTEVADGAVHALEVIEVDGAQRDSSPSRTARVQLASAGRARHPRDRRG